MQVFVSSNNKHRAPDFIPIDKPIKVWVKEIELDTTWYLIDVNRDSSGITDTDIGYANGTIERPFIDPEYKGVRNHRCYWISERMCTEIDILNNREAIGLLRRD